MLPENLTLADLMLYLGVLQEESNSFSLSSITFNSSGVLLISDGSFRQLTMTQFLIDVEKTLDL